MHMDGALHVFSKIFKKVDQNWKVFIKDLKAAAQPDDQSQIFFKDFLKILEKYGMKLDKE